MRVVWVYRQTQWVALVTTALDLSVKHSSGAFHHLGCGAPHMRVSVEQIVEYYAARWKIEAGFREIKQEIGSAASQTRCPNAVSNHLHFCMAATTITWLYTAHLPQAPKRRYAAQRTTEFAFADVRRALAMALDGEGFGIDCPPTGKPTANPLIAAVLRLVA